MQKCFISSLYGRSKNKRAVNSTSTQTYTKWQLSNIWPIFCCETRVFTLCSAFMGLLQRGHFRLSFDTVKWRCQGSYQLSSSKSVSSARSGWGEYFCRENLRQRVSPTSFRWCSTWGERKTLRRCVYMIHLEQKQPLKLQRGILC